MLGFFLPLKYRRPVLLAMLILLVGGLAYVMTNGVFAHNDREVLKLEREAPASR